MVKKVWHVWRTDGQTDGQTDGLNQSYSCLVAAKNRVKTCMRFVHLTRWRGPSWVGNASIHGLRFCDPCIKAIPQNRWWCHKVALLFNYEVKATRLSYWQRKDSNFTQLHHGRIVNYWSWTWHWWILLTYPKSVWQTLSAQSLATSISQCLFVCVRPNPSGCALALTLAC